MDFPEPATLHTLLSNHVVLQQLSPYLPLVSLLRLTAVSHDFRDLILSSPAPFARLDLRPIPSATLPKELLQPLDRGGTSFRAERMDEALTEDEFYCGPLRGIFGRLGVDKLSCVGTMVLDGLCVPAELVRELVAERDPRFGALRVLSIRGCGQLNGGRLGQVLRYATRQGRADGMPRLRALYVFGPTDTPAKRVVTKELKEAPGITTGEGAQIGGLWATDDAELVSTEDSWYQHTGEVLSPSNGLLREMVETVEACKGIVAFDAVLCRGPGHDVNTAGVDWLGGPGIASVSLRGCENCGSCPEGPVVYGDHDETALPLLAPPPLHSTTVKAAQQPSGEIQPDGRVKYPPLILRCRDCLRNRWCLRCNKWWCETCYHLPMQRAPGMEVQAVDHEHAVNWGNDKQVKVYLDVCVEHCLRSEILAVTDGMWG